MRDPLSKITITFVLIALAPFTFIAYEFTQIGKNEQMVRDAYRNQLDAILYSVNQYSDDIISSWANKIRNGVSEITVPDSMQSLINQVDVVRYLYLQKADGTDTVYRFNDFDPPVDSVAKNVRSVFAGQSDRVERLIQYERAGFRKMEALDVDVLPGCIPIAFAFAEGSRYRLGAMVIDLTSFIRNSLAPKLQAVSQGNITLAALRLKDDAIVYVTEPANLSDDAIQTARSFKNEIYKKDFWILPGYYMGIAPVGMTVEELVDDRASTNFLVLVLLLVFLVAGILFLYRNVRHQIRLSQAKAEFVSNVSHELRTPLSLIGLFAETLESGRVPTDEKKREYYTIINKEVSRLTRIVNRILNFSQLDAQKKRFVFAEVHLPTLCKEVIETYFYQLKDKGFDLDFVCENEIPKLKVDREAVTEALINLLDNAVKYSDKVKHITLRLWATPREVYVDVVDKGIGIASQHHHEIFEQFFRTPSGDVHTTKGSGLGLSLVKKIMEAHRGRVTVESAPGKGSTFRLIFTIDHLI